jgi:hypothetical protein
MERSVPRIGAWAGIIAVTGIVGYHLALMIIAGQRVSGTTDTKAIATFYGQSAVGVLGVSQFLVVIAFLVFAVALRDTLVDEANESSTIQLLTGIALAAAMVEVPIVVTEIAAQAALVTAVQLGEGVGGLFRFWDALYNSGLYGVEATWILAFGLAMRGARPFPRFMSWLSPLAALLLTVNVFAIWVGIPDAATLPSAVAIAAWLIGASIGLRRISASPSTVMAVAGSA